MFSDIFWPIPLFFFLSRKPPNPLTLSKPSTPSVYGVEGVMGAEGAEGTEEVVVLVAEDKFTEKTSRDVLEEQIMKTTLIQKIVLQRMQ